MALHEHNERDASDALVSRILEGVSVALICDAGTPLISDPGFHLVQAAHRHGVTVSPLPGPSAAAAALSVSGMPSDRFCFEGFLPARQSPRLARLTELRPERRSIIFLVSVHRIAATLTDMVSVFGAERQAFVAREMTKVHEQCVAAPLHELLDQVDSGRIATRGEFVVVTKGNVEPATTTEGPTERLLAGLAAVLPGRQAAAIVAEAYGLRPNEVYRKMLIATGRAGNDSS